MFVLASTSTAATSGTVGTDDSLNAHVRARLRYVECVRAELEAPHAPHAVSWPALVRVLPSVAALPGVRADASGDAESPFALASAAGQYLTCLPACNDPSAAASASQRARHAAAASTAAAICSAGAALPAHLRVECHALQLHSMRPGGNSVDRAHIALRLLPSRAHVYGSSALSQRRHREHQHHRTAVRPRYHPAVPVQTECRVSQHVLVAGMLAGAALSSAHRAGANYKEEASMISFCS